AGLSSITYSDQTCHCTASVSSSDHQVCREVYPDRWAVECWNGYYLDKASGECLEVCASGYELDSPTGTPPYSCTTAASDVDDSIRLQVCERHSNMKPVLEVGATSITCGCRVAWYGDDCDQLYQVYIPDELFREKVCDYAGYDITLDPLCDVSEFEMAGINGSFYSYGYHITSFEGAQYLINIYLFSGSNTDVTSIYPISFLEQLSILSFNQTSSTYDANIYDFNSLFTLNRLNGLYIYGNEQIYDISVSYRNVGLSKMYIAHTSHSAFIPLCRSEDDTDYWTFITTIFPIHSSDYKDTIYIPNSCPLNSDPGNSPYNCDTSNASCPSIVLNEVYNSVDGVNAKQCAFIAKEGTSGECYTVHDDYIRSYLNVNCSCSLTSGIITVATMRSALSCTDSSLSLLDVTSTLTVFLDDITTLQGLEYATSLTFLNVSGYDLSGDTNPNAEYDKLVVQILAKAVTYSNAFGSINSGLTSLNASGCGLSEVSDVLDLTPIADGDPTTKPFKLTSLNLSANSISDVSVFITSGLFPIGTFSGLDISSNNICDIANVASTFASHFNNGTSIYLIYHSQGTCPCNESYCSFLDYRTCRKRANTSHQIECWDGYYWNKNLNKCMKACPLGESLSCDGTLYISYITLKVLAHAMNRIVPSWIIGLVGNEQTHRTRLSVGMDTIGTRISTNLKGDVQSILNSDGSVICGTVCSEGFYGSLCDQNCPVSFGSQLVCNGSAFGTCDSGSHICTCTSSNLSSVDGGACEYVIFSDDYLSNAVKTALGYPLDNCFNISTSEMETISSLSVSNNVTSFSGLEYASNLSSLSVIGGCDNCTACSCSTFTQSLINEIAAAVPSLSELIFDEVTIVSKIDLSGFSSLTSLSIINGT
ncbi:hypothetical protein ADUPG1_007376, partial [Aduncisulcus paluster]